MASFAADLLSFFADRLKVHLRDQGARHDLVDAVFALRGQDDLLLIVRRVEALGKFLDTEDGRTCSQVTSARATSCRIEEKKDEGAFDGAPDAGLVQSARGEGAAGAIDQVRRRGRQRSGEGGF